MGGQPLTIAACPLLINLLQTGVCRRGDACPYSHGVFECWLHPSRYRTQVRSECCIGLSVAFGVWLESKPPVAAAAAQACREASPRLGTMLLPCPVPLTSRLPSCATQMCTDGPSCRRRVCFFAHFEHELRRAEDYPPLLNQQLHAGLVAGAPQGALWLPPQLLWTVLLCCGTGWHAS